MIPTYIQLPVSVKNYQRHMPVIHDDHITRFCRKHIKISVCEVNLAAAVMWVEEERV
jgi:hypothetical protein